MTGHDDPFNKSSKERRCQLARGYLKTLNSISDSPSDDTEMLEHFEVAHALATRFPHFEANDPLVEVTIRYAIAYMEEELDVALKLKGVRLLCHLIDNISPGRLHINMRAELIYQTLNKYLNVKESLEFLVELTRAMLALLNVLESAATCGAHHFRRHSLVVDSLLTNCYMSTDTRVRSVYVRHLSSFVRQMGIFSARHLEKYLTIGFDMMGVEDSAESTVAGTHMTTVNQEHARLASSSLDLVGVLVSTCEPRMHVHGRRIINGLLKFIHGSISSTLDSDTPLAQANDNNVNKANAIIKTLFDTNEKLRQACYEEFSGLAANITSRQNVSKCDAQIAELIKNI